jgi:hypothetical protein
MAYMITLDDYKAMFGVAVSSNDAQINALIPVVDDWINGYLFGDSGTLVESTNTDTMNGTGNNFLRLRVKPINSITSVAIGYNTAQSVTFSGTDFIFEADKAIIYFDPSSTTSGLPGYFPCGIQNIQVIYSGGFATEDVPPSIKYVAGLMLKRNIDQSQVNLLASKETLDQYSISYGDAGESSLVLAPGNDILSVLDEYKPVRYIF